jgi:hypothetical protein
MLQCSRKLLHWYAIAWGSLAGLCSVVPKAELGRLHALFPSNADLHRMLERVDHHR